MRIIFLSISIIISIFILIICTTKETFSVDDNSKLVIQCQNDINSLNEVECDLNINISSDTVFGISANYSLPDNVQYVSFTGNENCNENNCFEVLAKTENGFVLVNTNGITEDTYLGKIKLKFISGTEPNTEYSVSITNIEISNIKDEFEKLDNVITNIVSLNSDAGLKSIMINHGTINFKSDVYNYDIEVEDSIKNITIIAEKNDDNATITGNGNEGIINLHYGNNVIEIIVTSKDKINTKKYTLNVYRNCDFETSKYVYNNNKNYIYTKTDSGNTIINNLEALNEDLSYNINNNKLEINNSLSEILKSINIINFTTNYQINSNKIYVKDNTTYNDFIKKFNINNATIKLLDNKGNTINDKNTILTQDNKISIYYNDTKIDEYIIIAEYIKIDKLVVDNNIISRISLNTTYENMLNNINTNGTIKIKTKNGNLLNNNDIVKTGDTIIITLSDGETVYTISVLGDANGDGKITSADYVKIKKHIMNISKIQENAFLKGADVNNDNKITSADYVKIKKYIMNGNWQ